MKKITLLLIFLSATLSYGQIVLSEDFEAGTTIPAGWTNNDIAAAGDTWAIETGGDAALLDPGNGLVYSNGGADGNYAAFDSDANSNNGAAENVALESPVFDASALTAVTLQYGHLFAGNFGGVAFVEVSTDGTNWTTITTYSGDNYQGGTITTDVTAELAGQATAQLRFRWTGNYSVAWYVDNVSVFECTVNAPDAPTQTEPANMAVDVPIDFSGATPSISPFSWTEATTGDPADSFNISLGTDTAGTNIGTVTGATNGNGINYGSWAFGTTYYWSVTAVNCAGETTSAVFSFTTVNCTATAPSAVVMPTPVDMATDVPIIINNDGSRTITPFSWSDGAGDPGTSFDLSIGITTSGDDIGTVANATNGNGVSFTWEYNTTYYWRVDAINCAGTTNGTVWSFTTAAFAGDTCADAVAVAIGDVGTGDTSLASDSGVAAGSCGANGANQDLWFSFVAPMSGQVDVSANSDHIVIYASCGGAELACFTNANGDDVNGLTSGTTYYARAYNNGTARIAGPIAVLFEDATLSNLDFESDALFTYFPNPVKDILTLNAQQNITSIEVYNIVGQMVANVTPNALSSEVNLSNLKSGAYFIKVTVGNKTETVRIIKN